MNKERAQCHCGNISAEVFLKNNLSSYTPKACDCGFCMKHGAAYFSDSEGKMSIYVKSLEQISRYRHGDKLAEFLICKTGGVLVAVT